MLASKQLTLFHVSLTGETARTSEPASDAPGARQRDRRKLIFAIVSIGLFMASVDQTIVATALPAIERELHAAINWSAWTISIYALGQVIAMPMAGKISDMYGRKKVFVVSAAVFTLASLCCGFAPNMALLLLPRFIQALGGGAFMPSATGIVADHFGSERDRAVGMFTSILPVGGIIGPDLTRVGRRRSLKFLEESIVAPEADLPLNYRAVRVVTASGENVIGIRLNEDDISIQLRDRNGNLRVFLKDKVKEIRRDNPSLMPAYGSILSKKEIEDLVAYLSSLRGTP